MKRLTGFTLFIATFALLACALPAAAASKSVILATTTSTQDSGLLDVLVPLFEKESGFQVKTISVGSGQAMKMGEKGEADVLLVHSPDAEKKFMTDGFGVSRRLVMHNDFIIVGPAADPAKIKGGKAADALKRIAQSGAIFVSRGDNSGTHAKEKGLWKAAAINPEGQKWFQQTGLGMGQTLNVAAEKKGYTLTDRATYLSLKKEPRSCYPAGGRQQAAQHLPCHRTQYGQVAQGQQPGRQGLCRLHGSKKDPGDHRPLRCR